LHAAPSGAALLLGNTAKHIDATTQHDKEKT